MRIKIKLSRSTVLAFQEYKRLTYGDPNITVTNGYVLGSAFKSIQPDLPSIKWEKVNASPIPNVTDNNDKSIVGVDTTLNIDKSVLDGIDELQRKFLAVFGTKRVYRAFVVKLVIYAAILKQNNMLD
ncbi:hypothetical protein [Ornithinibacillus bavariensis]|uniref:Uncharacterized protein n=1 Tax=Ornithinibacillus bavariensis TaxID=545502 RepID=A0A920C7V6_9BACI|nr:hypothetical protein [Ornithinibacillus bavariensis]GIO28063.1 hypothetical protein J43TS3_26740 [Ornithinibacillus bavariensis]